MGTDTAVDSHLAVLVEKSDVDAVLDSLEAEGIYDDDRQIDAYGADRIALPVCRQPVETDVEAVVACELPPRTRGLDDLLALRGFSAAERERAPSSWAVVGSVVLVMFDSGAGQEDSEFREAVGEALLELHGEADTVVARGGVVGRTRTPTGEVVAGTGDTETIHVEDGTRYALDLSVVMFSPGNKAERIRMGEIVAPGECVFDMFAGIGYFALPMARAGATVTAAECNPEAYRFLVENAELNGVSSRLRAVLGDCRDVETTADRVVMGYYDAYEYLDSGLEALVSGGTVHLHEATPNSEFPARPIERLRAAAGDRDRTIEILQTRVVKSHSAGVVHGAVDARVR